MRILTHNFLQSNVKGTTNGYPLDIEVERLEVEDPPSEINRDLLFRLLPKLNYDAVRKAAEQLSPHVPNGGLPELPTELPPLPTPSNEDEKPETGGVWDDDSTSSLTANLHRILFDVHLMDGQLVCPGTGRKFPVKDSIPNMILHADEI